MSDALITHLHATPVAAPANIGGRQRRAGVVVIPARNEAARIAACLEALRPQVIGNDCAIVVVANGTSDDTPRIARSLLSDRVRAPGCVVDLGPDPLEGGVGRARAVGFEIARRRYGPAALLSSDADCIAAPDWLAQNLAGLAEADVVFGRILPVAEELAQLAPFLQRHGDIEDQYMQVAVRLAARLDPSPHDPEPAHRTPAGASLAFRTDVLDIIGGFPQLPLREDRAFARSVEQHDLKIRYCARAQVHASCRLEGRASGGMADTLRERCGEGDPFCDEWLEPAETFALRHGLRGRLRRAWPDLVRLERLLTAEGLHLTGTAVGHSFGAFWAHVEATVPQLQPRRLRHSEAARELPRLRALLAGAERAAGPACKARTERIVA